ncbi:MAG TPA: hypothetical protein VHO28_11135 [Ignavibacteriales bacterium]|nr:hypothetical protein [Ignavibacteriales bacterium]
MKSKIAFITIILAASSLFAQGSAGAGAQYEYRSLIDMPAAGMIDRGYVGVGVDVMPQGVLITKIEVGPFNNFNFGISYGAGNFIGDGKPDWYKLPGVNIKIRIVNETESFPAIAFGFDSQGKGEYIESIWNEEHDEWVGVDRYKIKSRGFYGAVSKNFNFLGYFGMHGAINYSLERKDGDKDLNFSFGFEKTIGDQISVVTEYDFAFNDNGPNSVGGGDGYLNAGLRWSAGQGFTIEIDLRDLLHNDKLSIGSADRAIKVEFIQSMF